MDGGSRGAAIYIGSDDNDEYDSESTAEFKKIRDQFLHQYVAKEFCRDDTSLGESQEEVVFYGIVTEVIPAKKTADKKKDLFHIRYDDDDEEDMSLDEVKECINLYKFEMGLLPGQQGEIVKKEKKPKRRNTTTAKKKAAPPTAPPSPKRAKKKPSSTNVYRSNKARRVQSRKESSEDEEEKKQDSEAAKLPSPLGGRKRAGRLRQVTVPFSYCEVDSDEEENEEEDRKPRAAPRKGSKKNQMQRSNKRKRKSASDDDDDDEEEDHYDTEDSEELDDDATVDDGENSDASEDGDVTANPTKKSRGRRQSTARKNPKAKGVTRKAGNGEKKSMAEGFEPMNNPLFYKLSLDEIRTTKQFLDPCGQEATDNIIGRLVGDQVDKIQGLLKRTLGTTNNRLGSAATPLKLGTACSGTDAPALALSLVKEQLELRGLHGLLHTEHTFSCEQEPFKQAYLGRNFDSVLYPDICKLTDDEPKDVFGRGQPIPEFNLFVAGTSCKNFSVLGSQFRKDIEEQGCSGETFLAAVEFIMKERPPLCILENVIGAPWEKMQEYICGKVKLSSCNVKKSIKGVTKKSSGSLTFELTDGGDIVVKDVPAWFGVRSGVTVAGVQKPGSSTLKSVTWPPTMNGRKICTLENLMNGNRISEKNDTLVFDMPIRYHTKLIRVDTKDFGLPQTRNRVYLFVWQVEEEDDPYGLMNDNLGQYWELIIHHLKSPVRHSLEAFVLNDNHDIIRVFREALRGPPGRQTKNGKFQESNFWESSSANLPHNKIPREKLGLQEKARSLTNWGPYGAKQIPPGYWLEYLNCCTQRQLDMLEILHASAARDPETHDSSFSSHVWNISQNASREHHRTACPGISGCITPGGEFFLPHLGRPLLGCEKLLIQGIPYFQIALGTETEVQLGDLAGNAMSLTVVGACMLGAITCKQLRYEVESLASEDSSLRENLQRASEILTGCSVERELSIENQNYDGKSGKEKDDLSNDSVFLELLENLAGIAEDAIQTSIWCTCETSGQISSTASFLQCATCKVSCCRNCCDSTAGYQLSTHALNETILPKNRHIEVGNFEAKLRGYVPPTLVFSEEGLSKIPKTVRINGNDAHDVAILSNFQFSLHGITRERQCWKIRYFARDGDTGAGQPLAEFSLRVGELLTLHADASSENEVGVLGELTSFLPARVAPLEYAPLEPIAVVKQSVKRSNRPACSQNWQVKCSFVSCNLNIVGSSPANSTRIDIGLTGAAATSLVNSAKGRKDFNSAKQNNEERRWIYATNWKLWPDTLQVNFEAESVVTSKQFVDISGTYKRSKCRQTINQGALWIRDKTDENMPVLYFLLKPEVSRIGPDIPIISRSLSHKDVSSIVAFLPDQWQPCDALEQQRHLVERVRFNVWSELPAMKCLVPASSIYISSPDPGPTEGNTLLTVNGLSMTEVDMLAQHSSVTRNRDSNQDTLILPMAMGQKAQKIVRIFNSKFVAEILQFAATNSIGYDLRQNAEWIPLHPSDPNVPFGTCPTTFPPRPIEHWVFSEERNAWERMYKQEESRRFQKAIEDRPTAFQFVLNRASRTLTVKTFPDVVAHHAAGYLAQDRGPGMHDGINVSIRLSASQFQTDPVLEAFHVPSCSKEESINIPLKTPYKLYDRQQKVVTKMLSIENRKSIFCETEMFEEYMPGSTGWSLIAKAEKNVTITGGVIADAIGAGKTVVSIALILAGLKQSRKNAVLPRQSSATLIVVPSHLIDQWKSEFAKFSIDLNVFSVYDLTHLENLTVKDIVGADCVICPVDILQAKKSDYLRNLLKKSGSDESDCPEMPQYSGQKELSGATGVWIPATSQDPYGGGNSHHNQKRRNLSARYTHTYLSAVHKLRTKEFAKTARGIPLEYYEWERIIVDEVHESLCCTREEIFASNKELSKDGSGVFTEKNRRAGRELLGIMTKDPKKRPLVYRKAIFGLTGTPLLDSPSRVIELASLIGTTYVLGLSSHWRKLERESSRDIFLHYFLEPKQSREIRRNLYEKCQDFIDTACCRNKVGDEMNGITLNAVTNTVNMSIEEGGLYLKSQSGIRDKSFAISPADFDVSAGHDITKFLCQNANLTCRKQELRSICYKILEQDKTTKIVVFADGRVGGGVAAREALCADDGPGCTWLDNSDSIEERNKKISWYQHGDGTDEDKARPRVLVLHFEHAAGLNLQTECYNMILFAPLYVGNGGADSNAVGDVSTELQAIGRVFRPGQTRSVVNVYRIEVRSPTGQECLDGYLIGRNTDEETKAMAVNAGD